MSNLDRDIFTNNLASLALIIWFMLVTGVSGYFVFEKFAERGTVNLARQVEMAFDAKMRVIENRFKTLEDKLNDTSSGKLPTR